MENIKLNCFEYIKNLKIGTNKNVYFNDVKSTIILYEIKKI